MALGLEVAVPAAVVAAACFGSAGVLQHRATHQVPQSQPLRPKLLFDLIRVPAFVGGVVLGGLGFAFQVVALRYAPLVLVQPILVTGVLFYLALASLLGRHRPDGRLLLGALLAAIGLAGFLLVSRPVGGKATFQSGAALPLGLALVAVIAACLLISSRISAELRQLPLATATAICYGVTAALVRSLVDVSTRQGWHIWTQWELYALIVVGPAGFLLNQNAFQSGKLGSVALTITTVGDPIVSIGIGLAWLDESIATGWSLLGEMVALLVMVGGIAVLAGRAQQLAEQMKASGQEALD